MTNHQIDKLAITVRGYQLTEETYEKKRSSTKKVEQPDRWYLVFDTETKVDSSQHVRFGVCHLWERRLDNGEEVFFPHKKWLFYEPLTILETELTILKQVAKDKDHILIDIKWFREKVFLPWVSVYKAYCIGFNLPFDISRLAINHTAITRGSMQDGFSFQISEDENNPKINVKQINTRAAMYALSYAVIDYELAKRHDKKSPDEKNERPYNIKYRGRFIDVATLAHVLFSRKFSLDSLCKHLKMDDKISKEDSRGHGRHLDKEYVEYAIQDVTATFACFNELRDKYRGYNLKGTAIESLYTEASVGKACLSEMGIQPWMQCQPDFSPDILGQIMSTFYGGRSEIHVRRTFMQGLYCDMLSMYPTVCTLMGLWRFVTSQGINMKDDTEVVIKFLNSLLPIEKGLKTIQKQKTWNKFHVMCEVIPENDIFPVRAKYSEGGDDNIGINHLTSSTGLFYMLPDVISSVLLTGKVPNIVRAIRFTPKRKQRGLKELNLLGKEEYHIDPNSDDMFKNLIEMRTNVAKSKESYEKKLAEECRKAYNSEQEAVHMTNAIIYNSEQLALKITANATSYGIFAEIIADMFDTMREVEVYSYKPLLLTTKYREKAGKYFHPLLASLITSASRLLLAIAEVLADKEGLTWIFCDTDSMTFGNHKGYSEDVFVEKVKQVQGWYDKLNPYNFTKEQKLFKFEDYNYMEGEKEPKPLTTFCISAKRYVLFHKDECGIPIIKKASVHGLGTYLSPYKGYELLSKLTPFEMEDIQEEDIYTDKITKEKKACTSPFKRILPPISEQDLSGIGISRWEYDLWHCILRAEMTGQPFQPHIYDGFKVPVRKMYSNSSPHLLNYYRYYNAGRDYHEQVRPFGFYIASSPFDNPFWYEDNYEFEPHMRKKQWEYMLKIAKKLGGVKSEGLPDNLYKKLPRSIRKKDGTSFDVLCRELGGIRDRHKEVDVLEWVKRIEIAYTNYQIGIELEKDVTKIGKVHPIALYDHNATSKTQKWIDRDTLEPVDSSLLETYADFITDYDTHAENKFSNGDTGNRGFTIRRRIEASAILVMGKEYRAAIEHVATNGEVEYGVRYTGITSEELTDDFKSSLSNFTDIEIAKASNVDRNTVARLKKDASSVSRKTLSKIYEGVTTIIIEEKKEVEEVKVKIQKKAEREGVRKIAREIGISHASLSRILADKQMVSDDVYNQMKEYLDRA